MIKPLKTGILTVLTASALVMSAAAVTAGAGTVNTQSVNVRASSSMNSAVVTTFAEGTPLLLSSESSSAWYKVSYGTNEGYISAKYLDPSMELEAGFGCGKVLSEALPIYSAASRSSQQTGQCGAGDIVRITGVSGRWLKVEFQNFTGYVDSADIELGHTESEYGQYDTMCFVTSDAWMYTKASSESAAVRYCSLGERLEVLDESGSWYKVQYEDSIGYVSSASLITYAAEDNGVGAEIVASALTYTGTPYVYGGSTPSGFDCSGFVYYLYHQQDFGISRRASTIWNDGSSISTDELKPGDPVFFSNSYSSSIEHVGIYVGEGCFIHSPSTGKSIKIDSLTEGYYLREYYGAVRIYGVE